MQAGVDTRLTTRLPKSRRRWFIVTPESLRSILTLHTLPAHSDDLPRYTAKPVAKSALRQAARRNRKDRLVGARALFCARHAVARGTRSRPCERRRSDRKRRNRT